MKSFSTVTVGVKDLDTALRLWVGDFGLELLVRKENPDPELASLWGLDAADIQAQALMGLVGHHTGRIHFIEFNEPDPPVRGNAQSFDYCPKNLDVYVEDMPRQIEALKKSGHRFRNLDFSEITAANGMRVREMHLPSHDEINIVLLQMLGVDKKFSSKGFAGIGPLVTTVASPEIESRFYQDILDLDILNEITLEGPAVEKMIGLPSGSKVHFSILGDSDTTLGHVEVLSYVGVNGNDLYPNARPKARGILHVTYETTDMSTLIGRLDSAKHAYTNHGHINTLIGSGEMISFYTPAGFRIEIIQKYTRGK